MESENGSGYGGAILFAAGTLFGAFLVYLILKPREQTVQQPCMPYPPPYIPYPQPPAFKHPADREIPQVPQVPACPTLPPPLEISAYKNNEKWVVEYGTGGLVKSIDIIRDAKCLTH